MPLISLSKLPGDEHLGAEHLNLPAPIVPVPPQPVAVFLDLSERHLEARQLGLAAASWAARLTGFIRPAGEAAATKGRQ